MSAPFRIDFSKFDGLVLLTSDRRKGVWGQSVELRGKRAIRTGGQLPTTATAHSLLTVALVSALRSITRTNLMKLNPAVPGKAKILIRCDDKAFVDALISRKADLLLRNPETKPLRAGVQFISQLKNQSNRFHLVFNFADENDRKDIFSLRNFAEVNVLCPRQFLPPVLAPVAVSVAV